MTRTERSQKNSGNFCANVKRELVIHLECVVDTVSAATFGSPTPFIDELIHSLWRIAMVCGELTRSDIGA